MKRSLPLQPLSREHHAALVLVKRVKQMADGPREAVTGFMAGLPALFATELEPHFYTEENTLLPAMGEAGGAAVERTLTEHRELRRLVRRAGEGDIRSLVAFGELLEAHVRFEERELFVLAETLLSQETLIALLPAHS